MSIYQSANAAAATAARVGFNIICVYTKLFYRICLLHNSARDTTVCGLGAYICVAENRIKTGEN